MTADTEIRDLERRVEKETGTRIAESNGVVATLEAAYALLAQADTPYDVKEIADKAEALRQYARRARLSHEAQNRCAELRLKATRKLGQMLDSMEKNRGVLLRGDVPSPRDETPKLEDLGVTKKQSSRAQAIGRMPEEEFERYIEETKHRDADLTISELEKAARKLEKRAEKERERSVAAAAMRGIEIPDRLQLIHGDFRDILDEQPDKSVDLVFTDPPYHESFLPLWSDLAELSARTLKPGGFLLAYSGQRFLDRVLASVGNHMDYYWMLAVDHTHGQLRFWDRRCWNSWKPIIAWRKPEAGEEVSLADNEWFRDRLTTGDAKTKDYHEWAQPIAHAEKLLGKFSPVGGLVLDPMAGSATIPIAALLNERRSIAIEEDKERYETAKIRIQMALSNGLEVA